MSVLFMGSGPFGLPTLDRMAELLEPAELRVVTVPDAPAGRRGRLTPTVVKQRALELGLDCRECASLKRELALPLVAETDAQLVIVTDFRLMLTKSFLAAIPRGCYNLHGSVLPRWRGAAPVARGVLAGDTIFGVTLYRMVRALDAGPVVAAREVEFGAPFDAAQIEEHIARLAADLLESHLGALRAGEVASHPQDESQVTLAPKLQKSEGWIDWSSPATTIVNHIRGMKAWPRSFCTWHGADGRQERLFIDSVRATDEPLAASKVPGSVVSMLDDAILVACGCEGRERLAILELQRAGKRSLSAREFMRGTPIRVDDRLVGELVENTEAVD